MNGTLRRIAISAFALSVLGGCAVYAPADDGYAYYPSGPVYASPPPAVYVAPPPVFFNFGYSRSWGGHYHGGGRGWGGGRGGRGHWR